jgi:putative ATPase
MAKDEGDSLFAASVASSAPEPLAARMRPRSLDEFIGQEHIVGEGRLLRRAIQKDQLSSLLFSGPPGTGKTTLARVIANTTASRFVTLNAVLAGIADIRAAVEDAKKHRELYGRRTILFVDEVHRWNKAQQDALLPWVENGTIVLIGATTENPFFEVNRALVSRSRVFQLRALEEADLMRVARAALGDAERGYGSYRVDFEEGALEHLVRTADGDARSLLNALELAVETSADPWPPEAGARVLVTLDAAEESIQRRAVLYDKDGDYHYDSVSAFIKSIRGSDPDAALYWLARMIYSGESPDFVFRRMLISASEDVGLADPGAVRVVMACAEAFDRIGLPEGQFHLAEAALYLATAPKSNSALAYFDAFKAVAAEQAEVPNHLKDASRDHEGFGHGEGYLYPHAYRDHWVAQEYLPESLKGRVFYQPGSLGLEGERRGTVLERREAQVAAVYAAELGNAREGERGLVWSQAGQKRSSWEVRAEGGAPERLSLLRSSLFELAHPLPHDRILVLDAKEGYFVWEALRKAPEGSVVALVRGKRERELMESYASTLPELERPVILEGKPEELSADKVEAAAGYHSFDLVLARDLFSSLREPFAEAENPLLRLALAFPGARFVDAESLPREGGRLSALDLGSALGDPAGQALAASFRDFEESFYGPEGPEELGMTRNELETAARAAAAYAGTAGAGAAIADLKLEVRRLEYHRRFSRDEVASYFSEASTYGKKALARFSRQEADRLGQAILEASRERDLAWPFAALYISGRFQSPRAGLDT